MQEMIHIMGVYDKFFIAEGFKIITSSVKFFLSYLYIIFQNDSILQIEASNNCMLFFSEYDSDYSHIYGRLPLPTRGFRQYPPPNRQIYVSEWE